MKPIIGVVSNITIKDDISISSNDIKAIENSGGEPIALVTKAEEEIGNNILDMCDGFLFQGGAYTNDYHYKILEYAYKKNKPVLGICLGFQMMSRYFFGAGSVDIIDNLKLDSLIDHGSSIGENSKISHNILINKDSYMYNIFGQNVPVNSRHSKTVVHVEKPFIISSVSEDGIIEGMEYIDKDNYIVGVQFHPEDLENMKPIFDRLVNRASLDRNK